MRLLKPLLLLLILFTSTALLKAQKAPVGNWLTIDGGDSITLKLTANNVFYLGLSDEPDVKFGGLNTYSEEESYEDSVFLDFIYTFDASTTPQRLTLYVNHTGTDSSVMIILSTFEQKDENTITLIMCDEEIYPEDGDDPKAIMKEFYTGVIANKDDYEAVTFKRIK